MSRKSVQKKRHTKPCRYFQFNKCPHSAEVCDFAHIIAAVVPLNKVSVCRYYAAGHCNDNQACKYPHNNEPRCTGIEYWSHSQNDANCCVRYPATLGHFRPTSSGFNSCVTYPHTTESTVTPQSSRSSIVSASNSISSIDSDELGVVTNDPRYPEHSHSPQSRVCVEDVSPLIHVPPYYSGTQMNLVSPISPGFYDYGLSNMPSPSKPHHPKPMSKQKALKYKTKPCKFFTGEKGCPNGSRCTFVHDEDRDLADSSSRPSSPVIYPSLSDGSTKNFFPVTWRVIGGGVRVGVVKERNTDLVSDEESDDFEHSPHKPPHLPPLKFPSRKRSNSIPSTPSNTLFNIEQLFSAESPGVL